METIQNWLRSYEINKISSLCFDDKIHILYDGVKALRDEYK